MNEEQLKRLLEKSKQEREKASYSSQIAFDKKLVQELRLKTILFVNKAKEILGA